MDQEIINILNNFGVMGLWGIVLYKIMDLLEVIAFFMFLYWGIKKMLPHIIEFLKNN